MEWYKQDINEVEKQLQVSIKHGLSDQQIEQRRLQFGPNRIKEATTQPFWVLFIKQFQDFMVIVLLAATLIAGLLGEYIDAIVIIVIVLLNGFIGFFQEFKAEKSLDKLKQMSAPVIRVLRDGEVKKLPAEEAVVGDVIHIKSGDRVPADMRLVAINGLETEESALTGESLPVEKIIEPIDTDRKIDIGDQRNMAFKGTIVTKGQATGITVKTGMNSAIGQIATLMGKIEKSITPLENRLIQLGKTLIVIVLFLTLLTVGIGIYQGHPTYEMFLAGVSLAVAVIPEGLPAIVTVALSLGVQRMIRRKAIVRQLSAIETLGCTTVICTDKTGTITENNMTVKDIFVTGQSFEVTGASNTSKGEFLLQGSKIRERHIHLENLLTYASLCNDAQLYVKKGSYLIDGDPTDGALLIVARKYGMTKQSLNKYQVMKKVPFDSTRKRMSVIVKDENNRKFIITKGAPEIIIPRCTHYFDEIGKSILQDPTNINKQITQLTAKARRVIAISIKPLTNDESLKPMNQLENGATFIGLIGMIDPPRKEVKKAIANCQLAGIKTVMITGDHRNTAEAIAKDVGIHDENNLIIEGKDLNNMSIDSLSEIVNQVSIFSRVTPEQKLMIVQAYQKKGHIVAMTGDGINDAPAIKASHIGVSMGKSGTDVAKEASSVILMDDNFHTLQVAIREGRNIYENIRKFVRYLLASNVGEIFVMLGALMLGMPLPLVPVQILWVNLVTDGLPAMALGLDAPEKNVMKQPPRAPDESIFARGLGFKIISRGILIGVVSLIAFVLTYDNNLDNLAHARSIAFSTLVCAQLIHVFDCRSERGIFYRNPLQNIYLIGAVLSSMALLLTVIYIESLQPIFHTTFLHMYDWSLIITLSLIPTIFFNFKRKK